MRLPLEIAVISLRDSRRRDRVAQWMAESPYPWRFFDAFRGPAIGDPQYDERRARILHGAALGPAEIGCFTSHFRLLREFKETGPAAWLLVVEDDVIVDLGFPFGRLLTLMEKAELRYLKLYSRFAVRYQKVGEKILGRNIVRFRGGLLGLPGRPSLPLGTQGYLISREGAAGFVGSVDAIVRPVDWQLDRYWDNGLGSYSVYPHPLLELACETTITRVRRRPPPSPVDWLRHVSSLVADRLRRGVHDYRLRQRDRVIASIIADMRAESTAPLASRGPERSVPETGPAAPADPVTFPGAPAGHGRDG